MFCFVLFSELKQTLKLKSILNNNIIVIFRCFCTQVFSFKLFFFLHELFRDKGTNYMIHVHVYIFITCNYKHLMCFYPLVLFASPKKTIYTSLHNSQKSCFFLDYYYYYVQAVVNEPVFKPLPFIQYILCSEQLSLSLSLCVSLSLLSHWFCRETAAAAEL